MGTDESTFNIILATRSFAQIRLMLHEYERITGHSFEKAIQKEFSGDIETGLLAVGKSDSLCRDICLSGFQDIIKDNLIEDLIFIFS